MIVMKFGGTSLGSSDRIKQVAEIISERTQKKPIVVVSAVGGITDLLLKASTEALNGNIDTAEIENKHDKIIRELNLKPDLIKDEIAELKSLLIGISMIKEVSPRTSDRLVSFGERISSKILAAYLLSSGIQASQHNSYDIGMITTDEFQNAEPLEESTALLKKSLLELKHIPVVTGFFGKTKQGDIATFGRGGSDYSAAIIGAAVDAEEIQIWTDVNGIMTCDPRLIKDVKTIANVSFAEASELAYFGAKVLHPKTILPAVRKGIPVRVLNTYEPDNTGTVIVNEARTSREIVKAISFKKNVKVINICSTRMLEAYGFLARIFECFKKHKVVVDLISTTEISVSVTVDSKVPVSDLVDELSEFSTVTVENSKVTVALVGEGIKKDHKFVGKTFSALGEHGINTDIISQGSSQINLSFVVDEHDYEKAIQILHKEYFMT